jgi:transposase
MVQSLNRENFNFLYSLDFFILKIELPKPLKRVTNGNRLRYIVWVTGNVTVFLRFTDHIFDVTQTNVCVTSRSPSLQKDSAVSGLQPLLTVCLIAGMVNGAVFKAWLAQDLLPKLTTSCVVVMDNATFHKVDGISELIEKAGHQLLYLPPYSPDLNPIERKWAQVKALRNKLRTNDIDALFKDYSM